MTDALNYRICEECGEQYHRPGGEGEEEGLCSHHAGEERWGAEQ